MESSLNRNEWSERGKPHTPRRKRSPPPQHKNFLLSPVHVRRVGQVYRASNKESCTQTSRTIIELAKLDGGYITPDSLNSSPRDNIVNYESKLLSDREYELHRSVPMQFGEVHFGTGLWNKAQDVLQHKPVTNKQNNLPSEIDHFNLGTKAIPQSRYRLLLESEGNALKHDIVHQLINQTARLTLDVEKNAQQKVGLDVMKQVHCNIPTGQYQDWNLNLHGMVQKSKSDLNVYNGNSALQERDIDNYPFPNQTKNLKNHSSHRNEHNLWQAGITKSIINEPKLKKPIEVLHAQVYHVSAKDHKDSIAVRTPILVNLTSSKEEKLPQPSQGAFLDQFLTQSVVNKSIKKVRPWRNPSVNKHRFKSRSYVDAQPHSEHFTVPREQVPTLRFLKGTQPPKGRPEAELSKGDACHLQYGCRKRSQHASPRRNDFSCNAELIVELPKKVHIAGESRGAVDPRHTKSEELSKTPEGQSRLSNNHSMSSLIDSAVSEGGLCTILNHVKSPDWNMSLKGFSEIIDLARGTDPEVLLPYMTSVNQKLLGLLRSPRSHVSRTACQISAQLFEIIKDTKRPEYDDIVDVLLQKTADSNKFIRQDANLALDSMVTHVSTFHAVRSICAKGPHHRNPLVRCAAIRLLICAVVLAGPDLVLNSGNQEHTRRRVVMNVVHLLEDRNLETRKFAERLYKILAHTGNMEYYVKRYVERSKYDAFLRTLKLLKKAV